MTSDIEGTRDARAPALPMVGESKAEARRHREPHRGHPRHLRPRPREAARVGSGSG
jgi:hypothetical protein